MDEPEIEVQGTPNPNAAKFVVDRPVTDGGSRSYFDAESARGDGLAERLFGLSGVRALLLADDFVTVTKHEDARWEELVERVEEVLREELSEV